MTTSGGVAAATVRAGITGPIDEVDPRKAVDYVSALVLEQIFEPPYEARSGDAPVKPLLFELLRAEDSGHRQYSAAIVPGVLFSDGTPLTAELAARSLRASPVLATSRVVVEVRDDRVWFTLAAPNPRFELTLTSTSFSIVLDKGTQLLGTGPFMFSQRPNLRQLQSASELRLVRNPHSRSATRIQEVEFHVFRPDADGRPVALVEALRSGRIDVTTALSASDLTTFQLTGIVPVMRPANSTAVLFFNTERRVLTDRDARRGLAMSLDLYEIAEQSYNRNPAAYIATNLLPPSMAKSFGAMLTNRSDGARLIAESGLKGARLSMLVPWAPRPYLPKPLAAAQVIQKQLSDAGVEVSLTSTKSGDEYFQALNAGSFDAALGGWIADTPDPAEYFECLLSSQFVGNVNYANHSRWKHPQTDAALERFRGNPSEAHRREIERILSEEMPFVPLVFGQTSALHSRRLRDVTITAAGSLPLAAVTVV